MTVNDGDTYEAAGFEWQVRTIPGHTVGHVVYLWEGQEPPVVFVGDVIFAGSIGRTDFPDGDQRQLILGIRSKLFTLARRDDPAARPRRAHHRRRGETKQSVRGIVGKGVGKEGASRTYQPEFCLSDKRQGVGVDGLPIAAAQD